MSAPVFDAPAWLTARPVAHRGLHGQSPGLVENTLSAALAAVAAGFAIECDVQLSADGEAVVFHDDRLDRLVAAEGCVRDRTATELAALSYRASADRIPTLAAFLDLVAGRVPVLVEVKSRFDGDLSLAHSVVSVLGGRREAPIAVMSFDDHVVAALRELLPGVPRGIVAEARYEHPEWDGLSAARKAELAGLLHAGRSRPDFLAWRVGDLPHAVPNLTRHFGMPVLTWTVRTSADRDLAARHADQIIFEGFMP